MMAVLSPCVCRWRSRQLYEAFSSPSWNQRKNGAFDSSITLLKGLDQCSVSRAGRAYEREQSPAAKDAIAQILTNSRMCAEGHRPICQDTGIVNVFLKIGMGVRFDFDGALEDVVNEGVRRAYLDGQNPLRASILA